MGRQIQVNYKKPVSQSINRSIRQSFS